MGPTPPGTGVMKDDFSATPSKSTSPTSVPSLRRSLQASLEKSLNVMPVTEASSRCWETNMGEEGEMIMDKIFLVLALAVVFSTAFELMVLASL